MMNKKIVTLVVGLMASVLNLQADDCGCCDKSGLYAGVQMGYVETNWDDIDQNAFAKTQIVWEHDNNYGVRPFVGYAYDEHFAFEIGYTYLNTVSFSRWDLDHINNTHLTKIDNYAIDMCLRLSLPLSCNLGVYTKVGASYVVSLHSIKWRANSVQSIDEPPLKHNPSYYGYMFGAGFYYDLTNKIRLDVSWTVFEGQSSMTDSFQPSPEFYALGISYRI
jgi:opacity protein-like surface antigen